MTSYSVYEADEDYGPAPDDPRFMPRLGVFAAMRRHWIVFLMPVLLFVGGGVAYGLLRTPTYTASAQLTVGSLDLSQPGALSGYASATQSLASNYSREIYAQDVRQGIERRAGARALQGSSVTATPIPSSPVFRVDATGPASASTIRLANIASTELRRYVTRQASSYGPAAAALLRQYRTVERDLSAASQTLSDAKNSYKAANTAANAQAVTRAQARFQAAKLRSSALSVAYQRTVQSQSAAQSVRILSRATSATSDRLSRLEIAAFAGLLLGGLLGAALATLRANGAVRRAILRAR